MKHKGKWCPALHKLLSPWGLFSNLQSSPSSVHGDTPGKPERVLSFLCNWRAATAGQGCTNDNLARVCKVNVARKRGRGKGKQRAEREFYTEDKEQKKAETKISSSAESHSTCSRPSLSATQLSPRPHAGLYRPSLLLGNWLLTKSLLSPPCSIAPGKIPGLWILAPIISRLLRHHPLPLVTSESE